MKKIYNLLFLAMFMASGLTAQTRYLQQVFSAASTTINQPYGQNSTVLAFPTIIKQPLIMDVYQPVGDTETKRPLVIYLHTGNFLPFKSPIPGDTTIGFNGSCGGTLRDSAAREICTRLAKMGYVATSIDYRAGWNPIASSDVVRRYGIINAAYRGVQDLRTCIRYFKKTVAEAGNPWKVDTSKIVIWGQGTGGYITLATLTLDKYLKIPTASKGKFLWDHPSIPGPDVTPMVIEPINGNIWGTSFGLAPNATGGVDTLCYPQHTAYTSGFALAVNMGGALADSSWIDPGQSPLISYHVPYDRYAPYDEGIVTVPTKPGDPILTVVEVQGSYSAQHLHNSFGNNSSFVNKPGFFDMTEAQKKAFANTPDANGSSWHSLTPGLYPFVRPLVDIGGGVKVADNTAPWEWSGVVPNNPTCNQNKAFAMAYIDTIVRFYAPRACYSLGLTSCINTLVGANEPVVENIEVSVAPNPASDVMTFTAEETIKSITIFNRDGRLVVSQQAVNNNSYIFNRNGLNAGLYIVKLNFEKGFMTKMVSFN